MDEGLPKWPDPDKLMFRKVDNEWNRDELLDQEGWFPLVDVMAILDPHGTGKYKMILGQREKLTQIGGDAASVMGLQQFGKQFWAKMTVFSPWFHQNEAINLKRIPKNWSLKTGLEPGPSLILPYVKVQAVYLFRTLVCAARSLSRGLRPQGD